MGGRRIVLLGLLLWIGSAAAAGAAGSRCVECHRDLDARLSRPVARWRASAHALASVGCTDCHGGDPQAVRGGKAHASFPGHPAPAEVAGFCGRCHRRAAELHAASGHARQRGGKPAVGCRDCHGSHDVANPPALFRLSEYCSSCHGLEYLPALPGSLVRALEADDRLTEALKRRFSGALADDGGSERRELREKLGGVVHRGAFEVPAREVEEWTARAERLRKRLSGTARRWEPLAN